MGRPFRQSKDPGLATIAQRNGLRLLKFVNSLLDFSRIEEGRVKAFFEPVDLLKPIDLRELIAAIRRVMVKT